MNARCLLIVLLLSSVNYIHAQDSLNTHGLMDMGLEMEAGISKMGRFSLSVNPAGALFFGPMLNAEVGLGEHLRFNTHVRTPRFSLIYHVITSSPERIEGYGIGGGIMGFFGKEGNWGKLYAGLLMEYSRTTKVYYYDPLSSYYTGGTSTDRIYVFAFHTGYRFRFNKGFFIQTGMYFFLPIYPDLPDRIIPLPQPDFRFGFEF